MKTLLLLVFASLALAVAKDYRPIIYEQAGPEDHHVTPNILRRSLAHRPQYGDYDEGGSGNDGHDDGKNRADVRDEDPLPESTQTQDPYYEDTTVVPPTSTADAQAEEPPVSEPTGEERSSFDDTPWPADTDATTYTPTPTATVADAATHTPTPTTTVPDTSDPPVSEPTQKDPSYEYPRGVKDERTTTLTSVSTVTHYVTVPFPSSSSGALNAEEPAELGESPPYPESKGPISIVPMDDEESPRESAVRPIELRSSAWPAKLPHGLPNAGSWNRTVASAVAPRMTTADEGEPWGDSPYRDGTPEVTDTADAVKPPDTDTYPEGPTIDPLSPTTGAVPSGTEQPGGTSGTRRWMPDLFFAGGVFMLMATLGEL